MNPIPPKAGVNVFFVTCHMRSENSLQHFATGSCGYMREIGVALYRVNLILLVNLLLVNLMYYYPARLKIDEIIIKLVFL